MSEEKGFPEIVTDHTKERKASLIKDKWRKVIDAVNLKDPAWLKNLPVVVKRGENVQKPWVEVEKAPTAESPINLPLKGEGNIELSQSDNGNLVMRITAQNSKGEMKTHPPIEFDSPEKGKYSFLAYGNYAPEGEREEIDRVLALFKRKDIDEERLIQKSQESGLNKIMQDTILEKLQ